MLSYNKQMADMTSTMMLFIILALIGVFGILDVQPPVPADIMLQIAQNVQKMM
jgi:hypothetical protein